MIYFGSFKKNAKCSCVLYHLPCQRQLKALCWLITLETFVNVLLFCTADKQKSGKDVTEMEILAPLISNCIKWKAPLISPNKMCTVTVLSIQKVKSAMKQSCHCKDCKSNYGYSMFGNAEEGFHFYQVQRPYEEASDDVFLERSLCLFQVSLA